MSDIPNLIYIDIDIFSGNLIAHREKWFGNDHNIEYIRKDTVIKAIVEKASEYGLPYEALKLLSDNDENVGLIFKHQLDACKEILFTIMNKIQ